MTVLRQSIAGLSVALLSVVVLWAAWITGQAENRFARDSGLLMDCSVPTPWSRYTLRAEDELTSHIEATGYTLEEILTANCLPPDANLPVGESMHLPPEVMVLLDPTCGPPDGWGYYTTEAGDSLSTLADEFEIDIEELMRANCFIDESDFVPGLRIYAPTATQEP